MIYWEDIKKVSGGYKFCCIIFRHCQRPVFLQLLRIVDNNNFLRKDRECKVHTMLVFELYDRLWVVECGWTMDECSEWFNIVSQILSFEVHAFSKHSLWFILHASHTYMRGILPLKPSLVFEWIGSLSLARSLDIHKCIVCLLCITKLWSNLLKMFCVRNGQSKPSTDFALAHSLTLSLALGKI